MGLRSHIQIHQQNDPEILKFFSDHRVRYRLAGDHLFIIRSRGRSVAAGPGDWLTVAADGEIEVRSGGYLARAQRAVTKAKIRRKRRLGALSRPAGQDAPRHDGIPTAR